MNELHLPLLEIAVLAPLVGAALAIRADADKARRIALFACLVTLAAGAAAWFDLSVVRAFEAHDRWTLLGWLPGGDPLVIDELSGPLLPLAGLQFFLVILATLRTKAARFSLTGTLVSLSIVTATLASREPWTLSTFLLLGLAPPLVELRRRGESTRCYTIHMGGFATLLVGGLALRNLGSPAGGAAYLGHWLVGLAVLVRSAAFPVHLWLPNLFSKASFGTSLLFTTPLIGAYAALRLVLPEAPDAVLRTIAAAALVSTLYAAGMSLVERDARRFFAYLLISQSSLVLLGLELMSLVGLTGALCVWLSVGLAVTGFGLTLRCVESRVGRIRLDRFNGLHDACPTLAGLFLLTGLASIGFPGTIGFIAIEVLIEGAIHTAPAVGVLVLLATALNGIAVMHAYFRVFTGKTHSGTIDLSVRPRERIAVLALSLMILGGGFFPAPGVASREHAAAALLESRSQAAAPIPHAKPPAHDPLAERGEFPNDSVAYQAISETQR